MTGRFQQQDERNLNFSKPAPTPQHGRKADSELAKRKEEPRAFQPRPGFY